MRFLLPLILLLAPPAFALDEEHARSAFLFAGRKEWGDATAHARAANEPALATLISWQYVLDPDSGAGFDEIRRFIAEHPDWPEQKKLRQRGEMALPNAGISADEVVEWFSSGAPMTGVGKLALAKALSQGGKQPREMIDSLVREAWRDGDFDEAQEISLLAEYRSRLRAQDDVARLSRLLWEGKTSAATRMFAFVSEGQQKLAKARMALQADKKDAPALVKQVPPALKNDPGLIYDRMRLRSRNDDDKGVREMLLMAPKKVPYPEKWWKIREAQIRGALDDGDATRAAQLLANHGQEEGQGYAEAVWLKGWLALEFEQKPKEAYQAFAAMFNAVKYPVSKSRAAYWAGRASARAHDAKQAQRWYGVAAAYPTTFYGQLAALIQNGITPLSMPAAPVVSEQERAAFEASSVVMAARLCIALGDMEMAGKLISHLVENAGSDAAAALAGELGAQAGKPHLSVRGAKKALQNNVVLLDAGYPKPSTPDDLAVPRELALAITRQESEFNRYAESPAGARGMMQLLPSTAKETAKKYGLGFDDDRLWEQDYNMTVGSYYLARMIDSYDGSYVMAIAAYNAGPGNVRKWVQKFGTPGNSIDGAVMWMEKIPFSETRNYVQRVLENMQVYRHIEAPMPPKLQLGNDLVR